MEWKWPAAVVLVVAVVFAAVVILNVDDHKEPESYEPKDPWNPSELEYPDIFPTKIDQSVKTPIAAEDAAAEYESQIDSLKDVLNNKSSSVDEIMNEVLDTYHSLEVLSTQRAFVVLNYQLHPSKYEEDYIEWTHLSNIVEDSFYSTLKEGLNGNNHKNVEKALESLGIEVHVVKGYNNTSKKEQTLLEKENSLIVKYNRTNVTQSNRDLIADIYVQLVSVRNDLADLYGYDNYADYAYSNVYGRDYTPEDLHEFYGAMDVVVPLSKYLNEMVNGNGKFAISKANWVNGLTMDEKVAMLTPFLSGVSTDMLLLLDFLKDEGLLYIDSVKGQRSGAYTVSLSEYNSALVYIPWSSGSVNSLIHEFGHASNMCLNPRGVSCYDVMEIHSQGLESLFAAGYSKTVEDGDTFRAHSLYSIVDGVFSGILITEFENWAYETQANNGTLTKEELYDEYDSLISGYYSNYNKLYWQSIHHVFDRPCYYVSYATSGLSALQIFMDALHDLDAAQKEYLDILYLRDASGYIAAMEEVEMSNMLVEDNYRPLLVSITNWVKLNIR